MDQANCLGVPAVFEFRGHSYKVAERTFEHECMFAQWVKVQSLHEIERVKDDMSTTLYKMQIDGWRHDCAMGLYQWGTPFVVVAAMHPAGSKYLALLALSQHQIVSPSLIDEIYNDADAWERLTAIMGSLNDDPNKKPQQAESR